MMIGLNRFALVAIKFLAAVKKMPFHAVPVVANSTGLLLEYPAAIPGVSTDASQGSAGGEMLITEDVDPGHRHFSAFHWLYPGHFLPRKAGVRCLNRIPSNLQPSQLLFLNLILDII